MRFIDTSDMSSAPQASAQKSKPGLNKAMQVRSSNESRQVHNDHREADADNAPSPTPGALAMTFWWGPGVLVNLIVAATLCALLERGYAKLRRLPMPSGGYGAPFLLVACLPFAYRPMSPSAYSS